jgi:hypothetical protein
MSPSSPPLLADCDEAPVSPLDDASEPPSGNSDEGSGSGDASTETCAESSSLARSVESDVGSESGSARGDVSEEPDELPSSSCPCRTLSLVLDAESTKEASISHTDVKSSYDRTQCHTSESETLQEDKARFVVICGNVTLPGLATMGDRDRRDVLQLSRGRSDL